MKPIAIATWRFGVAACTETMKHLHAGANGMDAVESGIRVIEEDTSVETVGYGGAPNSDGIVELDAAMMWGPGRRLGGVASLRDIGEAISVARRVLENTPHCLLAGEGAKQFAIENGFKPRNMLTETSKKKWEQWKATGYMEESHDTVCVLAIDSNGDVCAGTSTSGIRYKLPGRVGDTPLCGGGLYCDNEIGAAASTGQGEDIMRYAMSFRVVEEMRRGVSPMEACRSTMLWAVTDDPRMRDRISCVMALNKAGEWGAAASKVGFSVAYGNSEDIKRIIIDPV
ncbi:MAG: N(4)-(beta-N-acetylglucosaminyl)-L-asparaginase [Armatimonadota bacterium]